LAQFDLTDEEKAALASTQADAEAVGMNVDEESRLSTGTSDRTVTSVSRLSAGTSDRTATSKRS
jgi:hypothetical protein